MKSILAGLSSLVLTFINIVIMGIALVLVTVSEWIEDARDRLDWIAHGKEPEFDAVDIDVILCDCEDMTVCPTCQRINQEIDNVP